MDQDKVRHGHAGNIFHFRWAARRCLRLLNPVNQLDTLHVEGSAAPELPGECVIDVTEYGHRPAERRTADYYQLKHSSAFPHPVLALSHAAPTLKKFAERFTEHATETDPAKQLIVRFHLITNRAVSPEFRETVRAIHDGQEPDPAVAAKLVAACGLDGAALKEFVRAFHLAEGEGDYRAQRGALQDDLSEYVVGFVDTHEPSRVVDLVIERALPDAPSTRRKGEITREDVLHALDVYDDHSLYPAPPKFDSVQGLRRRRQHDELLRAILDDPAYLVIEAGGGLGKSVIAQQLQVSLPTGSVGLIYDCFGGGSYRTRSLPRHKAADACVQIANELADRGLCNLTVPMVGGTTELHLRKFIDRLATAIANLRAITPGALLVLFVDAADNAETAGRIFQEECFAHLLLREKLPAGCRLVMLCRPERTHLLDCPPGVRLRQLEGFREEESLWHLRRKYPVTTVDDGTEFHRLTGGNPRVQALAMNVDYPDVATFLASLGRGGQTVDDQIAALLERAIAKERELHANEAEVDAICAGLATLPPYIPLAVLAEVAEVAVSTIKSLFNSLGRSVWCSDDAVQFRDEPTEFWFQKRFAAQPAQISRFVARLEPLADRSTYVGKALPELLEQAGRYKDVIHLALSERSLPTNNPIDERDVRLFRLRHAFKAALKAGQSTEPSRLTDAGCLAFRAGEEMAGNQRQLALLNANVDVVGVLREAHQIQELAQGGQLSGAWKGSGKVYEASLLSAVPDFRGDARSRLRSANNWLDKYFEEKSKESRDRYSHQEALTEDDVVEFVWANLNLYGPEWAAKYAAGWTPLNLVFKVVHKVVRRLVDANRFAEIEALSFAGAGHVHIALAVAENLIAVGHRPRKGQIRRALDVISTSRRRPTKLDNSYDERVIAAAALSLLEAAAAAKLSHDKILRALRHYVPAEATAVVGDTHTESGRSVFARGAALRAWLLDLGEPTAESLLPKARRPKDRVRQLDSTERQEVVAALGALLPWYYLRLGLLVREPEALTVDLAKVRERAKRALGARHRTFDRMPFEMAVAHFQALLWKTNITAAELETYRVKAINRTEKKLYLEDALGLAHAAFRCDHLAALRVPLETFCSDMIRRSTDSRPEEQAADFVTLSRALLANQPADAGAVFKDAIEIVSRFGDEVSTRWQAVTSVAGRHADGDAVPEKTAFLFLRAAEIVSDTVGRDGSWDLEGTLATAMRLHSGATYAALSRWQDREVSDLAGRYAAPLLEAVTRGFISAAAGWAYSGFVDCHTSGEFIAACIERETDRTKREGMLAQAVRDLELHRSRHVHWEKLRAAGVRCQLPVEALDIAFTRSKSQQQDDRYPSDYTRTVTVDEQEKTARWDVVFKGLDFFDRAKLSQAITGYRSSPPPRDPEEFWHQLLARVPLGRELEFLQQLLLLDDLEYEEIGFALEHAQSQWLDRPAVRREWNDFLLRVGRCFATSVAQSHRVVYWSRRSGLKPETLAIMRRGMLTGMSEHSDEVSASTFFGFAANLPAQLSPAEAGVVLDYALDRFDRYIPPAYADGQWSSVLQTPSDPMAASVGAIWATLGSPLAEKRWEAAHAVRRLVRMECGSEIGALLHWMQQDGAGAFGAPAYPFYTLHARLYLLTGLAREASAHAAGLRAHAELFARLALEGPPHILIQLKAAEICRAIECAFPGTLGAGVEVRLAQVSRSSFPVRTVASRYTPEFDTPWHERGEVDTSIKFALGMDFGRDWLDPLGRVFGIRDGQADDLARQTLVRTLRQPRDDEEWEDPRQVLWNHRDRGMHYSHSDYPRNDNYRFYLAYHSLMITAARLLAAMPVARTAEGREDEWQEWLEHHAITRPDGRWLADRRDPLPPRQRAWVSSFSDEHWEWSLAPTDFLDVLTGQSPVPGWVCVDGWWQDCQSGRHEIMVVSSALADPSTAGALANSLRWADSVHSFDLPGYGHVAERGSSPLFILTGWVTRSGDGDTGRDRMDAYAKSIEYPPRMIGGEFLQLLRLDVDDEARSWREHSSGRELARAEIWGEGKADYREPARREGRRLSVAPDLLQALCAATGKVVIFCVEMDRRHSYGPSAGNSYPRSYQIFTYSADGHLRGAKESHKLG